MNEEVEIMILIMVWSLLQFKKDEHHLVFK